MTRGTVIVALATDLEEEAPIWYLRSKVAAGRGVKLVVANGRATEMDRWTWGTGHIRYEYGHELDALNTIREHLTDAKNVVFLVGNEGMDRAGHTALLRAVANLLIETGHAGKPNNGLIPVWPGANTQGAFDIGFSTDQTAALLSNPPQVLFLADADLLGDDALIGTLPKAGFTVAVELFLTATAAAADVVLPRQSVIERDGTFTNGERRVQRFYTAQAPLGESRPDWKIFADLNQKVSGMRPKLSAGAVMQDLTRAVPRYAGMTYPALARTEKQTPDVGGADLYYGGTAYTNNGGLGVQWVTTVEGTTVQPVSAPAPRQVPAGQLLVVPIRKLYNHEPEFEASTHLMHSHIDQPYAVFSAADAQTLGISQGDQVAVTMTADPDRPITVEVTARIDSASPKGVLLLARHLNAQPTPAVPVAGSVQTMPAAPANAQKVEMVPDVQH